MVHSHMRKADMIQRFLTSESRASDKQIVYMNRLMRQNHTLCVSTDDVDSKSAAMLWLWDAEAKRELRERVRPSPD